MRRARLGLMAVAASLLPLFAGACGDDASSSETLPPISTTTTTTTLNVTTTTVLVTYKIQSGDSLGQIANRFGVSMDELMALNGITNPDHIEVGQQLTIPPPIPTTTLPASTSSAVTSSTQA
ncbi:MAG: LysM domain-containing protein [Ilumatobacteraceae bacterium]